VLVILFPVVLMWWAAGNTLRMGTCCPGCGTAHWILRPAPRRTARRLMCSVHEIKWSWRTDMQINNSNKDNEAVPGCEMQEVGASMGLSQHIRWPVRIESCCLLCGMAPKPTPTLLVGVAVRGGQPAPAPGVVRTRVDKQRIGRPRVDNDGAHLGLHCVAHRVDGGRGLLAVRRVIHACSNQGLG
jgi:hypothetical protein